MSRRAPVSQEVPRYAHIVQSLMESWFRGKTGTGVYYDYSANSTIAIQYHGTIVAKCIDNDLCYIIELNTGGYKTATTKNRINDVLAIMAYPQRVRQKKYKWFIGDEEFYDGMRVSIQKGAQ